MSKLPYLHQITLRLNGLILKLSLKVYPKYKSQQKYSNLGPNLHLQSDLIWYVLVFLYY